MKFFKKLLVVLLKIIIVVVFVWLFLAIFWFNNLFNPADMWNNFFGPTALQFAQGNVSWDSIPQPPQMISSLSVLGQIPQLTNFIHTPIAGVPEMITPIVLGYLIPFAMALVFGGVCLGVLVLLFKFVRKFILKRPSKKSKRKGRYDKYDSTRKAVGYNNPYLEKNERKVIRNPKPEYGYPDVDHRSYYDGPRDYPPPSYPRKRYEPEPYGYPVDRGDPPPYGQRR